MELIVSNSNNQNIYICIGIHMYMAKQIFISDEAYKILSEKKGETDSFSKVILRELKHQSNVNEILKVIGKKKIDSSYLKNVKKEWKKWENKYV